MSKSGVIDFQHQALERLRAKVSALGAAHEALLAYARGHAGASSHIHAAALAALDAEGLDHLIHVVTQDWVDILGVDACALALETSGQALFASGTGLHLLSPGVLAPLLEASAPGIEITPVTVGAPIFGPAAALIRTQALIRLTPPARTDVPMPSGVLALGSRTTLAVSQAGGGELLAFLGAVVGRCLARWLTIRP